jgi:hypothetical protein
MNVIQKVLGSKPIHYDFNKIKLKYFTAKNSWIKCVCKTKKNQKTKKITADLEIAKLCDFMHKTCHCKINYQIAKMKNMCF